MRHPTKRTKKELKAQAEVIYDNMLDLMNDQIGDFVVMSIDSGSEHEELTALVWNKFKGGK